MNAERTLSLRHCEHGTCTIYTRFNVPPQSIVPPHRERGHVPPHLYPLPPRPSPPQLTGVTNTPVLRALVSFGACMPTPREQLAYHETTPREQGSS